VWLSQRRQSRSRLDSAARRSAATTGSPSPWAAPIAPHCLRPRFQGGLRCAAAAHRSRHPEANRPGQCHDGAHPGLGSVAAQRPATGHCSNQSRLQRHGCARGFPGECALARGRDARCPAVARRLFQFPRNRGGRVSAVQLRAPEHKLGAPRAREGCMARRNELASAPSRYEAGPSRLEGFG